MEQKLQWKSHAQHTPWFIHLVCLHITVTGSPKWKTAICITQYTYAFPPLRLSECLLWSNVAFLVTYYDCFCTVLFKKIQHNKALQRREICWTPREGPIKQKFGNHCLVILCNPEKQINHLSWFSASSPYKVVLLIKVTHLLVNISSLLICSFKTDIEHYCIYCAVFNTMWQLRFDMILISQYL